MRLVLAIAVLAALFCLGVPLGHAQGAPWCAVVSAGPATVEWHCDYRSVEECRPNVLAGNRGFCLLNPRWQGRDPQAERHQWRHRHRVKRH